jgi:hypothetical protein
MAALKDFEQLADDLEGLVGDLRSELRDGPDFEKLMQIADEISERSDNAAQTFSTINDTLMSRLAEMGGGSRKKSGSAGQSRERSSS